MNLHNALYFFLKELVHVLYLMHIEKLSNSVNLDPNLLFINTITFSIGVAQKELLIKVDKHFETRYI